ncbi:acyl-CoA dehydrogenase family protein [Streptomyces sp. NPDC059262]|uniref:acyl-CoA dehydrogenase family protein n=1 Tax=Streptomyces sp. NPDC059262 TaxID=3346797 RepID=UPI0036A26672
MDFELNDEQAMLRDVSRSALKAHATPEQVRAAKGTAAGTGLWRTGAELGWTGLTLPEQYGGSGQGLVELAIVAEELGRSVAPGPFVSTALVGMALAEGRSQDARDAALASLADGSAGAAWALAEHGGVRVPDAVTSTATRDGDTYVLRGRKTAVQDADDADWLLVTAALGGGTPASFLVERAATGTSARRQHVIDETRAFYEVTLDDVRVPDSALIADAALTARLFHAYAVLTAADALGAAEHLLDTTVEYAKIRRQFDRPIGSFQAIKHKCADMLMFVQGARAAVQYAAMAWDAGADDAARAASVAKSFTSEAMSEVAGQALQIHGGIGFTWEHDLHLYLRRIKADEALGGDAAVHQDRLCSLLLAARAVA